MWSQSSGRRAVRVVAGGVSPAPRRLRLDDLSGARLDRDMIDRIAQRAFQSLRPIDTVATDRAYRRSLIPTLVRDAFEEIGVTG